jgi:hypothetical protein
VTVTEELRHLLIELGEVIFDDAQFVQRQLDERAPSDSNRQPDAVPLMRSESRTDWSFR